MKKTTVLPFFIISFLALAGCSQFQAIFTGSQGESSYKVAKSFKKSGSSSTVENGMRSPIVTKKGTYYFVAPGDTLTGIAKKYRFSRDHLAQINDLYDSNLIIGRRLFIPNKKTKKDFLSVTEIIKEKKMARSQSKKTPKFAWPLHKYTVTSQYGWRRGRPHDGVDLSAKPGTPIYAAADGRVIYSKRFAGYGNLIVLKHGNSYFTAYAHATALLIPLGKKVRRGQKIATVGRTGRASGPHLHFEIRKKTQAIDPLTVLP